MKEEKMTIALTGRIDSNNAAAAEQEILAKLGGERDCTVILDADKLEYISSAGLRVILHLKKTFSDLRIVNVNPEVYEIFDMTGFTEMMEVQKAYRCIDVEGCEIIGKGFYGTVYRIDPETIVKVYNTPDCIPIIKNEQRLAKRAFVKGVPTAISYDIVKVGDNYGSVFELLKASTFNDWLIHQPEQFDTILHQYVDFLKVVHSAEMDAGTIPMARDTFIGYLDVIAEYLTKEQSDKLRSHRKAFIHRHDPHTDRPCGNSANHIPSLLHSFPFG